MVSRSSRTSSRDPVNHSTAAAVFPPRMINACFCVASTINVKLTIDVLTE